MLKNLFVLLITVLFQNIHANASDASAVSEEWKADVCLEADVQSSSPIARISVVGWKLESNSKSIRLEYVVSTEGAQPREVGFLFTGTLENDVSVIGTKTIYSAGNGTVYHEKIGKYGSTFTGRIISGGAVYVTNPISVPANKKLYVASVGYQCSFGKEASRNRTQWTLGYDGYGRPLEIHSTLDPRVDIDAVSVTLPTSGGNGSKGTFVKVRTNVDLSKIKSIQVVSGDGSSDFTFVPAVGGTDPNDPKDVFYKLKSSVISGALVHGISGSFNTSDNLAIAWFPGVVDKNTWKATVEWSASTGGSSVFLDKEVTSRSVPRLDEYYALLAKTAGAKNFTIYSDTWVAIGAAGFSYGNLIDRGLSFAQGIKRSSWYSSGTPGNILFDDVFEDGICSSAKESFQLGGLFKFAEDAAATAYFDGYSRVDFASNDLPFKTIITDDIGKRYRLTWPYNISVSLIDPVSKRLAELTPCLTAVCLKEPQLHADLTSDQWKSIKAKGIWVSTINGDLDGAFAGTDDGSSTVDATNSFIVELAELDAGGELRNPQKFVGHLDENPIAVRPSISLVLGKLNGVRTYTKVISQWKNGVSAVLPVGNPNLYKFRDNESRGYSLLPSDIHFQEDESLERRDFAITHNKLNPASFDITIPARAGPIEDALAPLSKVRTTIGYFEGGEERVVIPFGYYPANRIHYVYYSGLTPDERIRQHLYARNAAMSLVRDKNIYVEAFDASLMEFSLDYASTGSSGYARYLDNACAWANGVPVYRNIYGMNGEYNDFGGRLASPLKVESIGLVTRKTIRVPKGENEPDGAIGRNVPVYDIAWEEKSQSGGFVQRDHNNNIYSGWVDHTFDALIQTHYQQKSGYDLANRIDHGDGLASASPRAVVIAVNSALLLSEAADAYKIVRGVTNGGKVLLREMEAEEELLAAIERSEWRLSSSLADKSVVDAQKLAFGKYRIIDVDGRRMYMNMQLNLDPGLPQNVSKQGVNPYVRGLIKDGWTNAKLVENGYAPVGPDGWQVNLHHLIQEEPGPMVELLGSYHSKNTKVLHGLVEDGASFRKNGALNYRYSKFLEKWWKKRGKDLGWY